MVIPLHSMHKAEKLGIAAAGGTDQVMYRGAAVPHHAVQKSTKISVLNA